MSQRSIYELVVRQEPKQARMCGVGGKADRRPIDPPPIVQLRVIDAALQSGSAVSSSSRARRDSTSNSESGSPRSYTEDAIDTTGFTQSYLQNPYYFMFASLARPDDDAELHWLKDGRTRCTTGSVVSSLYHLKDPQNNNQDAGFFVFPDLSVRTEGSYRLKLSLYEVVGNNVHHCKSIYSAPFYVYTAKKFPGMEESTPLSCSLADQGIKIRIRKDIRVRKRPIPALSQPLPIVDGQESDGDGDDDDEGLNRQRTQRHKRMRLDDSRDASGSGGIPLAQQQQLPWPPVASTNPALGPTIPPPPAAPPNSGSSSTTIIPPPPKPGQELPPPNGIAMGVHVPPGSTLPGPSVFDGRGGGMIQLDNPQPAATSAVASNQQQTSATGASPMQFREPNQSEGAAPSQASPTPSQVSPPVQQQQHQYPAASTAASIAPQQPLQSQHHPTTTAPPPQPAPQPLVHVPPPIQHQPQHSQHVQHPQPASSYAPAHYSQWGANPVPTQPTMYDPYYHHQQHPHYATYAPPLPQPPPHPPARYDYTTGMYTAPPPPAMSGYGYYDQHQQHHQPHPQQQMMPHSYPQHQMHAPPPPQHQYVPSAPMTNGSSVVNNSSSTATDVAQVGNGTTGAVSSNPVQAAPNFSASSSAQVTAPTPAPAPVSGGPYDYTAAVYNGRPHNENPTARAGYVAQTTGQVPAPYLVHPAPPHPHAQTYALHATPSAVPPPHHPHVATMRHNPYGPPPLHPHAPPPHPAYSYTPQYGAPPPPAADWGAQPFVGSVTGHHTGWDAYGHHAHQSQHPQQQSHAVAPQTQVSSSSTGGMNSNGTVSSQGGHRVQLAPLMNTHESTNDTNAAHVARDGGNTHSPVMQTSPIRSSGTSSSPSTMRSGGRLSISTTVRERNGGEEGHAGYQSQGQGKKNPLSIGSIISDDAR